MKQALTAGGLVSVWFESAKIAFEKLEIDFQENLDLPQLKGVHPEYGEITIDFFVPVQGKTRMEITVQDAALIAVFKKSVVPAYKYVSVLAAQQIETEAEDEAEAEDTQEQQSDGYEAETEDQYSEQETEAEAETASDDVPADAKDVPNEDDAADEQVPQTLVVPEKSELPVQYCKHCHAVMQTGENVCPECGKKQKGKGLLIAGLIIGVLLLMGVVCFVAFKMAGGQNLSLDQIKSLISKNQTTTETDATHVVTIAEFNQTQKGMTYEEVCAALGSKGVFLEPTTQLTYSNGDVVVLQTYYWNAEGDKGANVCVTFKNGVAAAITQSGMQ